MEFTLLSSIFDKVTIAICIVEDQLIKIKHLMEQGRYLEARTLTEEELKTESSIDLQRLHALALSKSGMPGQAKEILEKVYQANSEDPETSGILGGIYKELFKRTEESNYAVLSRDTYLKNFSATGNYYTGINAATMSAIAGQARKGREIAKEVILKIENPGEFWQIATLGEAHLLAKDYPKSIDYYLKARQLAGIDWGKISSVYNQLWLIKHYMHVPSDILKIFNPPTVAGFVGHMIDHPSRQSPRFPESIAAMVKASIKSTIKAQKVAIGYCSLACGGDILFAEAMEEEGGEVNISLPFNKKDFVDVSVAFAGESWVNRFDALMSRHRVTYITQEPFDSNPDLFSMQSKVVLGSTILRSAIMRSDPHLITLLSDFDLSKMEGGTRDSMSIWPNQDKIFNISPNTFITETTTIPSASPPPPRSAPTAVRPALYTLVADLDTDLEEDNTIFFASVNDKMSEVVVPPLATTIADSKMVFGFTGLRPLEDFIHFIKRIKGVKLDKLRLSIGGGPILLDDFHEKDPVQYKVMSGHHFDIAIDSHRYCLAGLCIALSPLAYELAMYKINMELMSRISGADGEMIDVFKVLD